MVAVVWASFRVEDMDSKRFSIEPIVPSSSGYLIDRAVQAAQALSNAGFVVSSQGCEQILDHVEQIGGRAGEYLIARHIGRHDLPVCNFDLLTA